MSADNTLEKNERYSIEKVVLLNSDLKDLRAKFTDEIKEIGKYGLEIEKLIPQMSVGEQISSKDLKSSLSKIQWSKNKVKIKNSLKKNDSSQASGWGEWEKENPYRHFYNSENEFKEAISLSEEKSAWIDSQRRALNASRNMWGWGRARQDFQRQEARLKKLESGSSSNIEMQVASKLISITK